MRKKIGLDIHDSSQEPNINDFFLRWGGRGVNNTDRQIYYPYFHKEKGGEASLRMAQTIPKENLNIVAKNYFFFTLTKLENISE